MKTDDLIRAVVADNANVKAPVARTLMVAALAGTLAAILVFIATLGARSDFWWSIGHAPRFGFKFLVTLAVALPSYFLARRLSRPDASAGALKWLLVVPVLMLAAGVLFELSVVPRDHWPVYAVGTNARACMVLIPLLSVAPLAAILYALKQGAPANPALAGAVGGLLAAGIGATLYASNCVDDSPLFVSIWYPIAIATVVAAGALIGARALKW